MYRFGATTVARWLAEELPEGARAFIEDSDTLYELIGLEATNGRLVPRVLAPYKWWPGGKTPLLGWIKLTLDTPVILTQGENLAGKTLAAISPQICRAATGSHALPGCRVLEGTTNKVLQTN
jgi:hypothetical protein